MERIIKIQVMYILYMVFFDFAFYLSAVSLSNCSFCYRSDSNIKNFSSFSNSAIDYFSTCKFFFSPFFFTKHVIFSIQSYTGTFFSSLTFVNSFSSNANILDLNYVSPCVHVFTSFHFFLYSQRTLKFFYNYGIYRYGFVYKSIKSLCCIEH